MKLGKNYLKKIVIGMMCLCLFAGILPKQQLAVSAAKHDTELNIYAVYLDSTQKGESVILESRGEILVMDIGTADCTKAVVRQLQQMGAGHISIYFSHLHKDHIGGSDESMLDGLNMIVNAGFTIDTLYLPDPSLASESIGYPLKYQRLQEFMAQHGKIVYLSLDSEFEVGDAYGYVIGPVHPERFHPQDYEDEEYDPDGDNSKKYKSYTYYENNCSLITQVVCNNTVYLATGDALKDEMSQTVAMYGGVDGLKVDILKLSHHGTGSGNVAGVLKATAPQYIFAQNTYYTGVTNGQWACHTSYNNAVKYGIPYYVGNEKRTLIYHIEDDVISMYEDNLKPENKITGWKRLVGGDFSVRNYNYYYIDENGQTLSDIQKVGDKYYYFSKRGYLLYGDYSDTGTYLGWKTYSNGRRYFAMEEDGKAYMCKGFCELPTDGKIHFFNSAGYVMEGTGGLLLKKIGKYTYGFDGNGALLQKTMQQMENGSISYFGKKGRLVTDSIITFNGNRYYLDKSGYLATSQLLNYGDDQYYLSEDGSMICGQTYELFGQTYYFDTDGRMAKQKFVTINGKDYFCGSTGALVTNQLISLDGKSYYLDEEGSKVTSSLQEIGDQTYYFDDAGEMVVQEFVELNGNTCYFGDSGEQVKDQLVTLSGNKYYLNENGYLMKKAQVLYNSKVYYFDEEGKMVTSTRINIAGHTYYFGKTGAMVKGQKIHLDGSAYYFNENGIMETKKYVKINNRWYYCDADGKMKTADKYAA